MTLILTMKIQHKIVLLTALFSYIGTASAQQYQWAATMEDSVTKDGFYNIVLQPEVGSKLKDDLSDIRILDEEKYEVPFLQKSEESYFTTERFKEFPVVSKQIIDNCCTKLTIKNPTKKPINNICFILKNSDAVKVYRMAGSDDGVNWYSVKKYDVFYTPYSPSDTKVVSYINFPLTDYLYFRFDIIDRGYWDEDRWLYWDQDRWSYPLNILNVGYYETYLKEGKYLEIPAPVFTQSDSSKKKQSYIKITFNDNHLLNRIRFTFKGPRFYKRSVTLAKKIMHNVTNEATFEPITTLELNSYSLNEFDLDYFREKEFYLIVENDDNRPLTLDSIKTWQLTRYLKTYLDKGKKYHLVYGDSTAVAPVYDLAYFIDSIPAVLPTLPILHIESNRVKQAALTKRGVYWYENKRFIWLAIGVIILFLSFMSWKMLREMRKDKE